MDKDCWERTLFMATVDIQLMQTLTNVLGLGGKSKNTSFQ
jgi:hypothetical protein